MTFFKLTFFYELYKFILKNEKLNVLFIKKSC